MSYTKSVVTEGAEIFYDVEGKGPILLTIVGFGGDADTYSDLSSILSDEYTVVRYDRRCNSRSTGDFNADLDVSQEARDALAIVRAMKIEKVLLFANSGGAAIGLKLIEDYPEVITGGFLHEPAIMKVLPDAEKWDEYVDFVYNTYKEKGPFAAMKEFSNSLVGFNPAGSENDVIDDKDGMIANSLEYFFAHEYAHISSETPDLEKIKKDNLPLVFMAGADSKDAYYARTARVLAEKLDKPYVTVPGNHVSFTTEKKYEMVEALRDVLNNTILK
ncbi:alpha/beta fold hydrolase [Staphylococcus equorum]|uniref:alpha/beta fold hydrolase n=1 Tax=Staphylococcus equorum TaxID=246432 RepID=UPI003EC0A842